MFPYSTASVSVSRVRRWNKHMHKITKFSRIISCVAVLFLVWTANAHAATLFDRSLEKLQAGIEHVSPADFTFVVLGDSRDNDDIYKKVLALAKTYHPLFILHGGDYSGNGSTKETDNFLAMVNGIVPEVPFFVVVGNHENRKVFVEKIGPLNFALDSATLKLKLIAVDDASNVLKISELDYLKSQLATKRENTFVAMHVPPKTGRWNWHVFSDGAEELENALAEHGVTAAFYFHVHLYARDVIKGIPSIITAGAGAPLVSQGFPGEPVYHIVVVRVKNGVVTTEMVRLKE
jgi:Icc protein